MFAPRVMLSNVAFRVALADGAGNLAKVLGSVRTMEATPCVRMLFALQTSVAVILRELVSFLEVSNK